VQNEDTHTFAVLGWSEITIGLDLRHVDLPCCASPALSNIIDSDTLPVNDQLRVVDFFGKVLYTDIELDAGSQPWTLAYNL
jgi:hypothetical protein